MLTGLRVEYLQIEPIAGAEPLDHKGEGLLRSSPSGPASKYTPFPNIVLQDKGLP